MNNVETDGQPILLALRALKLGDLLVAVPALRGLRRAFPEHRILYAAPTWVAEALELVGGIDHLPTAGLDDPLTIAPGVVDVAVNLHGNGAESRQRIEELQAKRVVAHRSPGMDGPEWTTGLPERERWTRLLTWHGIDADPLDYRLNKPRAASPAPVQPSFMSEPRTGAGCGRWSGSRKWPWNSPRRDTTSSSPVARPSANGPKRRPLWPSAKEQTSTPVCSPDVKGSPSSPRQSPSRGWLFPPTRVPRTWRSAYERPSVVLFGPAPVEEWGPPPGPHVVLTAVELRRGDVFAADPDPALLAVTVRDVLDAVDGLRC